MLKQTTASSTGRCQGFRSSNGIDAATQQRGNAATRQETMIWIYSVQVTPAMPIRSRWKKFQIAEVQLRAEAIEETCRPTLVIRYAIGVTTYRLPQGQQPVQEGARSFPLSHA